MRYTVKDKLKMVKERVCEGRPLHEISKKLAEVIILFMKTDCK